MTVGRTALVLATALLTILCAPLTGETRMTAQPHDVSKGIPAHLEQLTDQRRSAFEPIDPARRAKTVAEDEKKKGQVNHSQDVRERTSSGKKLWFSSSAADIRQRNVKRMHTNRAPFFLVIANIPEPGCKEVPP